MLTPTSTHRGQLLKQYVCARITAMDGINLGLFDFDRHNAIYFFILNSDEQIYLRYGGRDSRSADTYLNLRSLELALEQGLTLHQQNLRGELPKTSQPPPLFPEDIPLLVDHVRARNSCVECHLIADYQVQQLEREGKRDRRSRMYCSPDIQRLGILLDVPRGLVVKESKLAAEQSGMLAGDQIVALDGTTVWTFGDLQHRYASVSRAAESVVMAVKRGEQLIDLTISLPERWWYTDLEYRNWSVEPVIYYDSRPLTADEKQRYRLNPEGFASEVTYIHPAVRLLKRHDLRLGDIVCAVDGVEQDQVADTCALYVRLYKTAGDTVMLTVLRDGQTLNLPLKTGRQSFRK